MKYQDLTGEFCASAYNKELIEDDDNGLEEVLKDFAFKHIFTRREIQQLELTGHSPLTGLLDYQIDCLLGKNTIRNVQSE